MTRVFATLLAAFMLVTTFALSAKAINVTVGGTVYDILISAPGATYASIQSLAEATPWYATSTSFTAGFATAYDTATGGDYGLTAGSDSIYFAYDPRTPDGAMVVRVQEGGALFGTSVGAAVALPATVAWAYVAPAVEVPEINGTSLAQALFVLMALGLLLCTRRTRCTP